MSDLLRNIVRLFLFIFVQVYILDKVGALHQYIIPYLYYLFILWIPFSVSRIGLLFIGFVTGMALDYFTNTPGLHAAPCVLIAYLRPFVINILSPKDTAEFNYREPSPRSMGWTPYLVYVLILTVFHHLYLVILEWLSFGSFFHLLIKVLSTTAISLLLVIITELLFSRKMNYRTNTA
ncbi:MAG: rod shape-determining protein MreD [Citrobacter freundii]|nr:MAG: rod shape-determining protein MreD [Citrobacter freundii]